MPPILVIIFAGHKQVLLALLICVVFIAVKLKIMTNSAEAQTPFYKLLPTFWGN